MTTRLSLTAIPGRNYTFSAKDPAPAGGVVIHPGMAGGMSELLGGMRG